MRRLWVHIGTHKTGTTSLQAFLNTHSEALEREGILFPHAGTLGPRSGHHNIAWELRGDSRFNAHRGTLSELVEELSLTKLKSAVISSEGFEYLIEYPHAIRHFEALLHNAGWDPHYVVYFRPPLDYAISLYHELVQHGLKTSLLRFLLMVLVRGVFKMHDGWTFHFDRAKFLQRWRRSATGPIQTRQYREADTVANFLLLIGASENCRVLANGAPRINIGKGGMNPLVRRALSIVFCLRFGRLSSD